ncbi:pantoate--beta-alanine ligase [Bacteroidales bacterium]|nr:pantoate--beta-alanine ligase [Bacteroidales bacterium]
MLQICGMKVFDRIASLQDEIFQQKQNGKKIGFVPTMGALHPGHISLVKESKESTDVTIVSIFVNPTQFNNKNDLKTYPRAVDKDLALLKEVGCDMVFIPQESEIYPEDMEQKQYELNGLDIFMEGEYRPGHFNGVAMVVHRLFDIVSPSISFFGEKDFQQLAIIKQMAKNEAVDVEIKGCKIIRENDGLAMSSRNLLLEPEYRTTAPEIYKALKDVKANAGDKSLADLKKDVVSRIENTGNLKIEYFEIVDTVNLKPVDKIDSNIGVTACIAVHAGNVRLIDNITIIS